MKSTSLVDAKSGPLTRWSVEDSAELYGIRYWGQGFFDISEKGELVVYPRGREAGFALSLMEIIGGLRARGINLPVVLRFSDILDLSLEAIYRAFDRAVAEAEYRNIYRGVYPIKVNQQQQVIEEILKRGRPRHHGLEAGSKAELIAALGYINDPEALVVCNGYKDAEFIDLALYARKLGLQTVIVLEMPREIDLVLERSRALGVEPILGIRAKLTARGAGHWGETGGDRSLFGLGSAQIIEVVDRLRQEGKLHCLRMLHFHIGSQIPDIRYIRAAIAEAARIYVNLAKEGAAMGMLNVGGGLAVDYDGSHTNFPSSRNYSLREYAADVVEGVMFACDEAGVEHPMLVSESGRATVALHSVLLFNVLAVNRVDADVLPTEIPAEAHEMIHSLAELNSVLTSKNLQECFHDALYYRDEIRSLFEHGVIDLRQQALAERLFWSLMRRIWQQVRSLRYVPDEIEALGREIADVYYGNFSLFQSLPDSWAIDHLFPVMPVHRLNERPAREAIIADITCDSDGKIDRFPDLHDVKHTLPLHEPDGSDYYLGVFLIGAYQETLGDLHNLLGDTNVVQVEIDSNGKLSYTAEVDGDTVADVLTYVEHDPAELMRRMKNLAETAVREGHISPAERAEIIDAYRSGLYGYTYFEG